MTGLQQWYDDIHNNTHFIHKVDCTAILLSPLYTYNERGNERIVSGFDDDDGGGGGDEDDDSDDNVLSCVRNTLKDGISMSDTC